MSTRGDILRRAAQVESDAVPEPWRPSDDENALATVSDREHYRKNLVTLPDGAGEVPAYVWDFSRTPTIPNDVREEWTRGSAGRVLGPNGKYVSRGSDVPRLSYGGEDPGLLVEAAGRTNHALDSSDADQWVKKNSITVGSEVTSLIKGEKANLISNGGGFDFIKRNSSGTFSSSQEVVSQIFEENTAGGPRLQFLDANGNKLADAKYDFGGSSINLLEGVEANARKLEASGPNGGTLVQLIVRYDPTSTSSGDLSGNNRGDLRFFPDDNQNSNSTYFHHAQLEEAPNASSPIVTQGSPVTRAGDDYAIFEGGQPPWWNPNEGTIILDLSVRTFSANDFANQMHPIGFQGDGFSTSFGLRNGAAGESVYFLRDDDSSIQNKISDVSLFALDSIAFSFTSKDRILSVNGTSSRAESNGDFLSTSSMSIGAQDRFIGAFSDLIYTPRALPESTLNQITS